MPKPLDQALRKTFIDALMRLPGIEQFSVRGSLILDLPNFNPTRLESQARTDLEYIINGLVQLGRLDNGSGARPLIVVANAALSKVPAEGEVAQELQDVVRGLEQYYGGDAQPPIADLPDGTQEALVFGQQRDTRVSFGFVAGAMRTGRSIARLAVPRIYGGVQRKGGDQNGQPTAQWMLGTGWLIAPSLLITNYHVVEARERTNGEPAAEAGDLAAQVAQTTAWFDYQQEKDPDPALRYAATQLVASNPCLDYALIELKDAAGLASRRPLPLADPAAQPQWGDRINIAQHPQGGPLRYAIRNNFYMRAGATKDLLLYQTDTEEGASGSPVCNDSWQVVGLHRAWRSLPRGEQVAQEVKNGRPILVYMLNEAVSIQAVLNDLAPAIRQRIQAAQAV